MTPQQVQADKLIVQKAGFGGLIASGGLPFWTAGGMLQNPSTKNLATQITVQATAYGANGKVAGTGTESVTAIHARQTLPVAVTITGATAPVAKVDVLASAESWFPDPDPQSIIVGKDVAIAPTSGGEYSVNVTIAQRQLHARDLHNIRTYAVCFDTAGNINDAGYGTVQLLPANGQAGTQINSYGPTPTTCQVAGTTS